MKEYKLAQRIAIIDTETTNVYWSSAAPVQVAGIIIDNKGNVIDTFNEKIKTTHKIDPEASKVHGIYAKDLVGCRDESDVILDYCAWMTAHQVDLILTYNGETFDRPMLNTRCGVLGLDVKYFDKNHFKGIDGYYDCVKKAKDKNLFGLKDKLGRKWKLTLVSEALGINNENAHDALADVTMLKNIWLLLDPMVNPQNWDNNNSNKLF